MIERKKLWMVIRVQDYRCTFLAEIEGQYEFVDLGTATMIGEDRETMYQLARDHGGLLLNADGFPGGGTVTAHVVRLRALRTKVAADMPHGDPGEPEESKTDATEHQQEMPGMTPEPAPGPMTPPKRGKRDSGDPGPF